MSDSSSNLPPGWVGRRVRRFGLLDAIVMIAAVAVGLWGGMKVLAIYQATGVNFKAVVDNIRSRGLLGNPYHVLFWFEITAPSWLSLGVALFALRRLGPKPRRSTLGRQPGNLAIVAATFGAVAMLAASGLVIYPLIRASKLVTAGFSLSTTYPVPLRLLMITMVAAGASVAAGWGRLLLDGASRGEADWIEWSGRIVGVWLMLAMPFYLWAVLITY